VHATLEAHSQNRNLFSGGGEPRKLLSGPQGRIASRGKQEMQPGSSIENGSFDQKPEDYKAFLAKFDGGSANIEE